MALPYFSLFCPAVIQSTSKVGVGPQVSLPYSALGQSTGKWAHHGLVVERSSGAFQTAFSDWTEEVEDEIIDRDRAAVRFTSRGTLRQPDLRSAGSADVHTGLLESRISGRFVTERHAKAHPNTTQKESIPNPGRGDTGRILELSPAS